MSSVDYKEYTAKRVSGTAEYKLAMPPKRALLQKMLDTLCLPYALYRHRALLREHRRVDNHTYTCFVRAPSQLRLLSGPILDHLGHDKRLDITLFACSNGAEPYTIASWLMQAAPEVDFHIHASDLHEDMIAKAKAARYSRDEVLHSDYMTDAFLRATFEEDDDGFVVRPEVRDRVSFAQANLLDGEGLRKTYGQAPLVVAQNVLFHLEPEKAAEALRNLHSLTAPGGAMMIEGMDLGLRETLTEELGLEPFRENQRRIYEETRVHTPLRWWRFYWGTEPFMWYRRSAARRYATAFKRPAT